MIELVTCPFAGVICKPCQFPITNDDMEIKDIPRAIGKHEVGKHKTTSPLASRQAFAAQYDNEMETFARTINDKRLVDHEGAQRMYFGRVGIISKYPHCGHLNCGKLVHSNEHCSKKHTWACTEYVDGGVSSDGALSPESFDGVTSTEWKVNSPSIIPVSDFDFNKPEYFTKVFYKHLHDNKNTSTRCSCGSNVFNGTICSMCYLDNSNFEECSKANELQQIITNQMSLVDSSKVFTTVQPIEQQLTPNMWIRSNGWDKMLVGCQANTIVEYVSSIATSNEERILNGILDCLRETLTEISKIEPSHQILSEVQRRTKFNDIDSRFPFHVLKLKSTWEKYFQLIMKVSLVYIRLMEDNDKHDNGIPKPTFTEEQKSRYNQVAIPSNPKGSTQSRQMYMEFLLSLVDVKINKSMKDVSFLVVLAMISLKKDSGFASATDTTPKLAAILAVYKLLFLGKSIGCFSEDSPHAENNDQSWVAQIQQFVSKHFILYDEGKSTRPCRILSNYFCWGKK